MGTRAESSSVSYEAFRSKSEALERFHLRRRRQRYLNVFLLATTLLLINLIVFYVVDQTRALPSHPAPAQTFCYFGYDENDHSLQPENINGTLCDHIIFGFAAIENNKLVPRGKGDNRDEIWRRTVKLKERFPHLSVMISIGAPAAQFSATTSNETSLRTLVESAVQIIQKYEFNGLDIDWEFPAWGGMPIADQENFISLLRELRKAFDDSTIFGNRNHLLLTTAVAAPITIVQTSYKVPDMALYLDYCLLMGYDFNRFNKLVPLVEFNSPLHRHTGQVSFLAMLNIAEASELWVQKGMPREKLVVGMPFYGVTFKLADRNRVEVGSPAKAVGLYGGSLTYARMCALLEEGDWTVVFHNESRVPYAYRGDDWITFENPQSIQEKTQWVLDQKYAGIMTFDLNYDDVNRTCKTSKENFPLQTIVFQAVKSLKPVR
ncbi:chitinase-like protein 4 [Galendromus occidentalis]|uniref:Chitinase-like protein 4 n=1 Tax=Galendromus occidentalis TaxID=34638 RepID=A0AAJ6VVR9_9ACAR|nr:chitinase-like protein 4 [Galendromus occidentalis]